MWIMATGNRRRGEAHPQSKLTNEQVLEIRRLFRKGFSLNVIARNYKVSKWNIKKIVMNETWTHLKDEVK